MAECGYGMAIATRGIDLSACAAVRLDLSHRGLVLRETHPLIKAAGGSAASLALRREGP